MFRFDSPIRSETWQRQYDNIMQGKSPFDPNNAEGNVLAGAIFMVISMILAAAMTGIIDLGAIYAFVSGSFPGKSFIGQILAACVALSLGYFLFRVREFAKKAWFPPLEMFVGVSAASYGLTHAPEPLAALITFATGVRIIIDSFTRFKSFAEVKRAQAAALKGTPPQKLA